ncbi:MAG: DUF2171 domain-containing protein [Sphingomicrobium sp.]
MANDRYDTRDTPRDERSRWSSDRDRAGGWRSDRRDSQGHEDRGFFERAGDEVASWFGDEDAERRRREDQMRDERERSWGSRDRESGRDRERERGDWFETRGPNERGGFSERDYNPSLRSDFRAGAERDRDGFREDRFRDRGRDYRPLTGDYGRSEQFSGGSSTRGGRSFGGQDRGYNRSQSAYGRDEYRRTSFAGSREGERDFDPHYRSWRDRHLSELDRDYDDYRRENQARFESDFGSWRERRQQKRGLLAQIREHMEVVGNDDQHVGKIDRVAGDRIILTKSDPESGGAHHSLSCSDIDRVEGDRVILDCSADQARERWRDESRSRALFEREDQGEMGPRMLDRSFEGTYR